MIAMVVIIVVIPITATYVISDERVNEEVGREKRQRGGIGGEIEERQRGRQRERYSGETEGRDIVGEMGSK
jgi:predicted transposase YdaD